MGRSPCTNWTPSVDAARDRNVAVTDMSISPHTKWGLSVAPPRHCLCGPCAGAVHARRARARGKSTQIRSFYAFAMPSAHPGPWGRTNVSSLSKWLAGVVERLAVMPPVAALFVPSFAFKTLKSLCCMPLRLDNPPVSCHIFAIPLDSLVVVCHLGSPSVGWRGVCPAST